mmetsp:Transcript_7851/g.12563  ORF Transcript_7851/g.12563 Transcript_7851/m.12563 type:complete len:207 (+) Transcript_7851:1450-2070(+)
MKQWRFYRIRWKTCVQCSFVLIQTMVPSAILSLTTKPIPLRLAPLERTCFPCDPNTSNRSSASTILRSTVRLSSDIKSWRIIPPQLLLNSRLGRHMYWLQPPQSRNMEQEITVCGSEDQEILKFSKQADAKKTRRGNQIIWEGRVHVSPDLQKFLELSATSHRTIKLTPSKSVRLVSTCFSWLHQTSLHLSASTIPRSTLPLPSKI